ncbi:AAA family ATPase [Candidatus Gracilibacteria bacterium]|nr:MAG: AAA family ATPase [Candidatus Gracilibacteria bacterium]
MPKGILLYGPPGTGKTLAAKVIANESGILFYMLTAKDFVGNLGIEALEEKFSKLQSPSIVFIDEIDAIGQKRDYLNSYDIKVLNTFLQKMDGFVSSEDIFFVGATNNINILDEALLRAGRFDLKIFVDYPDLKGREEIFKIYINKSKTKNGERLFVKNIDYKEISLQTENFVGADIKELIRRLKQNLTLKIIENNLNLKGNEITSGDILIEIKNYKKEKNISPKKIGFEA